MTPRTSRAEREGLYARSVASLADTMTRCARTWLDVDPVAHARAVGQLQRYIAQMLSLGWLLGARRVVLLAREAERARLSAMLAAEPAPFVPALPFEEAVADILERYPVLAEGYRAVSEVYATQHAFALAKSTDEKITARVRDEVAKGIRTGDRVAAQRAIAEIGDWTDDYADTVFRTNAATAYTAGTFAQARDPDIAPTMPALEYQAVRDADTRPNHAAAHGMIAATDDPIWETYAPPRSWRCRCDCRLVSRYELERLGLYDAATGKVRRFLPTTWAAAHPDPGFRTGALASRLATA